MKLRQKVTILAATLAIPLFSSLPVSADDTPLSWGAKNIWFHQVPRVKKGPVIDGKPGDACWKKLPILSNFGRDRYGLKSTHPMIPMFVQLGFDDTYLYGLWKISNPDGAYRVDYAELKKKQLARMHDVAMYWNSPSVELRIDGRRDRLGETMIQMNMVGQKQAMQLIATGWSKEYAEGWDIWADYQYASDYDESGWWIELKVSLKDLGAEARPGYIMGANFRYFHPGAYFAWTPAGYDVSGYGDLLLVEAPLPIEEVLEIICPDYRSAVIRMPQPDKVVVVERGVFSEVSYEDTIMSEVNAIRRKRQEIKGSLQPGTEIDGKTILASLDKQLATIEKELAQTTQYKAHDLMRLRQPLDRAAFALKEAQARMDIYNLLRKQP